MKPKKWRIFIGCYYILLTVIMVLAIVLLRNHLTLTYCSLLPCLYIIDLALYAFKDPLFANIRYNRACKEHAKKAWRLLLPLPVPFIFFFSDLAKASSFFPIGVGLLYITLYSTYQIRKDTILHNKKVHAELKEQERRENEGDWK